MRDTVECRLDHTAGKIILQSVSIGLAQYGGLRNCHGKYHVTSLSTANNAENEDTEADGLTSPKAS